MFRKVLLLSAAALLGGCASISYPLPKCDGYSKRPLNRSMWEWQKERAGDLQPKVGALPTFGGEPLAYASLSAPGGHPAFVRFDEADSYRTCEAG